MLNPTQQQQLDALLASATLEQRAWLAGYLQGLVGAATPTSTVTATPLTVFYATETGNAKALALEVQKAFKSVGFKVNNASVNTLEIAALAKVNHAVFIASTHGDGEPPEAAKGFFQRLGDASDSLHSLSYTVLGLGDSSYPIFCGAATTLDGLLHSKGAQRLAEATLLDVDYATHIPSWLERTLKLFTPTAPAATIAAPAIISTKGRNRLDPVRATVTHTVNLNDEGSDKATYHIELEPAEPLSYTCGDAAGILLPDNDAPPRLYSLASSPAAHGNSLHLTVALARHRLADGSEGYGLCSHYLSQLQAGDAVSLYIHANQLFNLPEPSQDAIMIGAGTGVAPYRGFVYERAEQGHTGRNWLVFGNPHQHCDFLYQAEWQEHLATDALHKISLAFSRDSARKIYVQHRLREEAEAVRDWVGNGAAVYVCGAKAPMAVDVEATLTEILGAATLATMAEQGRYVKDVY